MIFIAKRGVGRGWGGRQSMFQAGSTTVPLAHRCAKAAMLYGVTVWKVAQFVSLGPKEEACRQS